LSGAPPLRLEFCPSRALAALVVAMHATAAGCVVALVPGAAGMVLGALVLALGIAAAWDRALLRAGRSARAIELLDEGDARIVLNDGGRIAARFSGCSVTRYWVAIPVGRGRWRRVLVPWDMIEPGGFRRLRLWALWGRARDVAPAQPRN
jgi:hypothetical protein